MKFLLITMLLFINTKSFSDCMDVNISSIMEVVTKLKEDPFSTNNKGNFINFILRIL